MIPLATTTVTVTEPESDDQWAEPYGDPGGAQRVVTAAGVRAVIGRPSGREQRAGGDQSIWDFELVCDLVPVSRLAEITDENTDLTYQVVWVMPYPDFVQAGLRLVQGEV